MKKSVVVLAVLVMAGSALASSLMVTEFMSKSDTTEDWFELTNFGASTVDITSWSYDDESEDLSDAVPVDDVTSIAPGESIIVLQIDDNANKVVELQDFRSFWGGLSGVQIATLNQDASGMGKGDGITLFDATNDVVLTGDYGDGDRMDPDDLVDDSHAGVWAGGEKWDSANYIGSGWVGGAAYNGEYGIIQSSAMNSEDVYAYASPGFAVPEPATLALLGLGLAALRRRK